MTNSRPRPFYEGRRYVMSDSIGYQLSQVMQLMRREVDLRMTAHGLTDAQWKPLWMLQTGRATTANELARMSDIDAGAMTRLIDRLAAKGLLERTRSDIDRRVVQLQLTPAGEQAAQQVPQVLAAVNNDFLRGFSADEWHQLQQLLQRLASNGQALRTSEEVPA